MKQIKYLAFVFAIIFISKPAVALEIVVKGLFKDTAILIVDGQQKMLKAGKRSDEGILLISADSRSAIVEIDGVRQTLTIEKFAPISTKSTEPEKATVRINATDGGHYYTQGRINGRAVDFLIDTGATTIAMNRPTAEKLGIQYEKGEKIRVSTANGIAEAYRVRLNSVRIGNVEVKYVDAAVSLGDFPSKILLGNSFLSRVNMRTESGLLILEAKF
ncbi:retropepsin-like aspartic protease family protein [Aurantivibrio infirmus]